MRVTGLWCQPRSSVPRVGRRAGLPACVALMVCASGAVRADETLWDVLRTGDAPPPVQRPVVTPNPGSGAEAVARPSRPLRGVFGLLDTLGSSLRRLGASTKSDIKLNGQHSLRYHIENVSGSRDSYENATYYGRRALGGAYTDTDLTVSGKVLGLVNFETRYTDNAYGNPYDNRLKLSYATKAFSFEAGDIQAGVTGNSLVDFSRSLKGVTLSANVASGVKLSTLYSEEKAQTRTLVINGANRSGPYYVFAGQVVDGSARVRINNRDMVLGQDYTLDPYTGELNFLNGLIVNELDTIAVTFETYGYNQSPGLLTGWRADVTSLRSTKFGFTYLSQLANRNAGQTRTKTEQFYGYNSATTPYVLEQPVAVTLIRDEDGKIIGCTPVIPMTVTVGALPQIYGVDYVVDPLLPNRVYFKMAIPSTQIIRIEYTPSSSGDTSGDRSVLGVDMTTSLGKLGSVTAELASSKLDLSGSDSAGSAWQIRSDMKLLGDRMRLNWTLKNIGSSFTAVQSPGFRRNERGATLGFDYQASKTVKLNVGIERSRRPAYDYSSYSSGSSTNLAQSAGLDDYNHLSLRSNWQLAKGGVLSFNHNSMTTALGLGGRSENTTDTLSFQHALGRLSLDASLGLQKASTSSLRRTTNSSTGETTETTTAYGSDSLNARLGAKWRLGEKASLDTQLTNSSIKSIDGKRNTAQDVSLNFRTNPMKNLTLTMGYQLQSSGGYSLFNGYTDYSGTYATTAATTRQASQIGYLGGLTGYYGGGVNSGLGTYGNYSGGFYGGSTSVGNASFGGNSRGLTFAANYQPRPGMSVDMNWTTSSSIGDYLFNSKRNSLSLSTTFSPNERLSMVGGAMVQGITYVGSTGNTSTTTLYFNAQTKPIGKLIANFNANMMRSSNTATSSTGTGTGTGTGDTTGGYYGSGYGSYFGTGGTDLTSFGIRLEYPIWMGNNLYLQFDNADSSGYLASVQRTLALGIAFDLGHNMQFMLGWRNQQYLTKGTATTADYSYHVRSLDADIGLRF